MNRRSLTALAALALGSTTFASAADAPKPMRTLVYAVQYSAQTSNAEQTSGFSGSDSGPAGTATGHGMVERKSSASDDGKLTVDVAGFTADGGLIVDCTYAGKSLSHVPIRVAILSDGRLSFDPAKPLAPEAVRLLPLLARGLVAGRDVSVGSSWKIEMQPPVRGSVTYHVNELRGEQATLAIDSNINVPGPRGYDEQDHGTAEYATDRLCPISFDLQAHSRHQPSPEQYVTSNEHFTARLVSDTFLKK